MTYLPAPPVTATPKPVRRSWWRRIGRALLIWGLETFIGMIPLLAHEASSALAPVSGPLEPTSALPEICLLTVIASALALLALLRDWFQGDATGANPLTLMLAVANILVCIVGSYLYPYAVSGGLIGSAASSPWYALCAALLALLMLAGERGYDSKH